MPPAIRFTREAVLAAATQLVRREGASALNARSVAREVGGSTQPIFRIFSGMEELLDALLTEVAESFFNGMRERMATAGDPYLAMQLHYVAFANDEPELFKFLFLRDRITTGTYTTELEDYEKAYAVIQQSYHISHDQARALFTRTWTFAHGMAVSIATKYVPGISNEVISGLLQENCQAVARQLGIALPEV